MIQVKDLGQVNPIFVIGSPRSGTSLVRLILTSHSDICIPPESAFWIKLRSKYIKFIDLTSQIESFTEDLFNDQKFRNEWMLNRESVRANLKKISPLSYPMAVSIVHWTYMESVFPDARIWGDKNPSYLKYLDTIWEDFPTARVIHIIRDIRSIYASMNAIHREKSSRVHWTKMYAPLPYATEYWHHVCAVYEKTRSHRQCYTLFYEDLVSQPEAQVEALCSWLSIPFQDSMLQFHQLNRQKELVPSFALKWEQKTLEPVDQNRADSWRKELSSRMIEAVETLNGPGMRLIGYQPVSQRATLRGCSQILFEYIPIIKRRLKKSFLRAFPFLRKRRRRAS